MTLLIRSVQLLGSAQNFPENVDVFISGEKISALGNFPGKKADEIIDGQGVYVSPGFIDVDTDSDHYLTLFTDPEQEDFVKQGVTTIVGGNCGASLAPLLYGSLESIQKWADTRQINVDWHSVLEFLKVLETRNTLGVNFTTLIGHSTIRRAIVGEVLRDLTKNELVVFAETLKKGMLEGGSGLSTGLGYVHSRQAPYQEIKYLAEVVKGYNGVYATHLRHGGADLCQSVDETIKVCEETGVRTLVSHLMPIKGFEKEYETALSKIESLPQSQDFHFDIYPFDTSVLALYTFLPTWAQNGGVDVMVANIKDAWMQSRIIKDLPRIENPHGFIVAQAPYNQALVGRSLNDLMEIYSLSSPQEALLKLMTSTNLKANIFYRNINPDLIMRALTSPRSLIATNAASMKADPNVRIEKPERAAATFTKFLSLVEEKKIMPLHAAIKKITETPAKKFNLAGRGVIQEGNFADLVGFKNGEIKFTIVNGRIAYKDGVCSGIRAGKVLRHHAY